MLKAAREKMAPHKDRNITVTSATLKASKPEWDFSSPGSKQRPAKSTLPGAALSTEQYIRLFRQRHVRAADDGCRASTGVFTEFCRAG